MIFPEELTCSCGIHYEEQITYRAIDDLPPFFVSPPRCAKCRGLITPDQREERANHISRALEVLNDRQRKS